MNVFSDVNFWREVITLAAFVLFIGIGLWAYSKKRDAEFSQISNFVVLDDDTHSLVERSK